MDTPVRPAQGALGVGSMLYVSIAAAANRVWAQCQRYGGARERASRAGHGELNVSMHTEQSSPVHSGSGGAAGTHPRGRPPGRGIEPKAASAVASSPKASLKRTTPWYWYRVGRRPTGQGPARTMRQHPERLLA